MIDRLSLFLALVVLCSAGCVAIEKLVIPKAQAIDGLSTASGSAPGLNHQPWTDFLQRYARADTQGVVRVGYGDVSDADRARLDGYIETLLAVDTPALSRLAQLAHWANLYNAKTVSVILAHYPVRSIRTIRTSPIDAGPWNEKRMVANGRELSLHDVEHGIVRPGWPQTPEIHYLLNCAAVGCPNLGRQAYTAANIEASLEAAARAYVNDPRGVTVLSGGRVRLSKIYAWYRRDFGGSDSALLEHLQRYAAPELRAKLAQAPGLGGYAYDWTLNDQALATP